MKLVVATPLYPPEPGGPATYAKLLEEGLLGFGDTVTVVKFNDVRKYPKGIRHLVYCKNVMRAARGADCILALDPVSTGLPALVAARILGKKFVVKIVGDFAWEQGTQRAGITDSLDEFVQRKRVPVLIACFRSIQNLVARSAIRVIVPSEYLKHIITVWGIPSERISVIYNSIHIPSALPDVSAMLASVASPRVVTIGRLVPWKCIDGVIDAVAELDASLVVVGDGPEKKVLEERAREKLPGRSLFTGQQPHEDTLALMKAGNVFVLNSSYEGLSHLLIEALMLGKVIVATKAGGNGELVTDEGNGLLVEVGNTEQLTAALKRVLSDEELRARLSARAQESSAKFSTTNTLTKTHELLASLV